MGQQLETTCSELLNLKNSGQIYFETKFEMSVSLCTGSKQTRRQASMQRCVIHRERKWRKTAT